MPLNGNKKIQHILEVIQQGKSEIYGHPGRLRILTLPQGRVCPFQ